MIFDVFAVAAVSLKLGSAACSAIVEFGAIVPAPCRPDGVDTDMEAIGPTEGARNDSVEGIAGDGDEPAALPTDDEAVVGRDDAEFWLGTGGALAFRVG